MALDQDSTALLAQLAALGAPPITELTPAQARQMAAAQAAPREPGQPVERVEDTTLTAADGGEFAVRVLRPTADPAGIVVYLHGGGWVVGDIDQFDALGRRLAVATGCAVVLVDYRKAPEHPYPCAVQDAWVALRWADEHRRSIAGRWVPLVVAGDSAGGNLAAVLARRATEEHGPELALQVLVYPVTDADLDRPSYRDPQNQLLLTREAMAWFWDHYAPADRRAEPDASPLRAADLRGLPPAAVLLAEHDPLHDEGRTYADALRRAGVPVHCRLLRGQMHGVLSLLDVLPAAGDALDDVAALITAALRPVEESR